MINIEEIKNNLKINYLSQHPSEIDEVGVELEFPVVSTTGNYTENYSKDFIKFIENELDFLPYKNSGYIFQNKNNLDIISFEYSTNAIEFSMHKSENLLEISDRFYKYYNLINKFLKKKNLFLAGLGLHPHWKDISSESLDSPYHKTVKYHLEDNIDNNTHKLTPFICSSQTHLNVKGDIPFILNLYSFISMVKGFLFSNSVDLYKSKKFEDMSCVRDYFWWNSNLSYIFESVGYHNNIKNLDDIISDMLNRSLFYVSRNGKYYYIKPTKLIDYFSKEEITALDVLENKEVIISPKIEDLDNFRSFKAIELTKKKTFEIRDDCQQPINECFGPSAFNLGIFEMSNKAHNLALEMCEELNIKFDNFIENRKFSTSLTDIKNDKYREKLSHYAREFVNLSIEGLKIRGKGEEILLSPILKRKDILENNAKIINRKTR